MVSEGCNWPTENLYSPPNSSDNINTIKLLKINLTIKGIH